MDEARGTRSPMRPRRGNSTRSSTYPPAYRAACTAVVGNAREKGCRFDSREGSRLVRPMRQIEFIGSALDRRGGGRVYVQA